MVEADDAYTGSHSRDVVELAVEVGRRLGLADHTIEGQRMLENVGGPLARVGALVRSTHEDFDGTGYPDGLSGEQIPIAARICSACDALSAMTTDRAYRAGMALPDAIAELRRCAGTQFDPCVVGVLTALLESGEAPRVETAAPAAPAVAGIAVVPAVARS